MLRPLVSVACLAAATAAAAEPARLSGQTIKETLAGAVIEIDTPAGTTIPVRFSKQGLVSGDARGLAAVLGAARDRGRWWVAGDQLCVKWFRWFESEVRCIDLQQDGARLFWRGPQGRSGTATIAERPAPVEMAKSDIAKTVSRASVTLPVLRLITPAEAAPAPNPAPTAHSPAEPVAEARVAVPEPPRMATVPLPQKAPPFAERRATPPVRPAAARSKASEAIAVSFRVAGVEPGDILNVRSGPSEEYPPVGGIPPASRAVQIVGPCRDAWCPIRHGRVSGWVNRYYLTAESSAARAPDVDR
jgi:Bacterial SH3 domain